MHPAKAIGIAFGALILAYGLIMSMQKWLFDSQQQRFMDGALLAEAAAEASMVKRVVTTHYAEYGHLPEDNRALGLGAPASFAGGAIRTLAVRHGNIVIEVGEGEEPDVMLWRVAPSLAGVGSAVKWSCETDALDAASLRRVMPQCKAVAAVDLTTLRSARTQPPPASVSALIAALHQRRRGLALDLIRTGVNVNASADGLYPLELAVEWGNSRVVTALIKAGADPDLEMPRRGGETPLMLAVSQVRSNGKLVRQLLARSRRHGQRDDRGRTLLMLAAQAGNSQAADALLGVGASLDAVDHKGNTAMNYAVAYGKGSAIYRRLLRNKNKRQDIVVIIPERTEP
ncbi:MAG: ankyrin repeat domain-containing protein [Pseudomonadota bacterium]